MKTFLKYIGLSVLLMIAALFIFANITRIIVSQKNKEYSQSLEGLIEEVNTFLPHKGFEGFDFFTINIVFLKGDTIVWDGTLDPTFFYPIEESLLPESVNGGILNNGDRKQAIDMDTIFTNESLRKSHHLDLLYYHLIAKKSGRRNLIYEELMKRKYGPDFSNSFSI